MVVCLMWLVFLCFVFGCFFLWFGGLLWVVSCLFFVVWFWFFCLSLVVVLFFCGGGWCYSFFRVGVGFVIVVSTGFVCGWFCSVIVEGGLAFVGVVVWLLFGLAVWGWIGVVLFLLWGFGND